MPDGRRLNAASIGDKIASCFTRKKYEVTELGIMHPEEVPTDCLRPGQVGFVACSMKESSEGWAYLSSTGTKLTD